MVHEGDPVTPFIVGFMKHPGRPQRDVGQPGQATCFGSRKSAVRIRASRQKETRMPWWGITLIALGAAALGGIIGYMPFPIWM